MNPQTKKTFLGLMVSVALSQLGVEEKPRGSNWSNIIKQYLAAVNLDEPAAWCMALAVWTAKSVCARLKIPFSLTTLAATGSVQQQVDHCKAHGTCVSADDILSGKVTLLPGWLMCVWEEADGWWHYCHTGVVVKVNADGTFQSSEGNTNDDGGRQGYGVMTHTRRIADRAGDGHAKYCFLMTC